MMYSSEFELVVFNIMVLMLIMFKNLPIGQTFLPGSPFCPGGPIEPDPMLVLSESFKDSANYKI